jgi:hypothetical protein
VAYWARPADRGANDLELLWWVSPAAPEVVGTGADPAALQSIGLATTAPDAQNPAGKPHVVFQAVLANGNSAVVYATRTGPSEWTPTTIVQDSPSTAQSPCLATTPAAAGDTCGYDYTTHQPVAITASEGGDVRIFFAARHFAGTLVAQCVSGVDGPVCNWSPPSPGAETDAVSVAWLTASTVQTAPLAMTNQPSAATVAIDSTGVMHLALYDAVTSLTNTGSTTVFSTRYLRVGPAGQ